MRVVERFALPLPAILLLVLAMSTDVSAQESRQAGSGAKEGFKEPNTRSVEQPSKPYQATQAEVSKVIAFITNASFKPETLDALGEAVEKYAEGMVGDAPNLDYAYMIELYTPEKFDRKEWLEKEWHFTGMVWQHKTFGQIKERSLTFNEAKPAYEILARMKLLRATLRTLGVDLGLWEEVRNPQLPGQSKGKPGWGKGEREARAREFGKRMEEVKRQLQGQIKVE